jgi:hypothetical protein
MPKIEINGKTYENADEVPPELRGTYQKMLEILNDADGNGIPDFLEGKPSSNVTTTVSTVVLDGKPKIFADSKVYSSVEELPPDARLKYDQAVAKLGPLMSDVDGNGIPDIFEGTKPGIVSISEITPSEPMKMTGPVSQEPPPSVIQDESSNFPAIAIIMIVALVMVGLMGLGVYLILPLIK